MDSVTPLIRYNTDFNQQFKSNKCGVWMFLWIKYCRTHIKEETGKKTTLNANEMQMLPFRILSCPHWTQTGMIVVWSVLIMISSICCWRNLHTSGLMGFFFSFLKSGCLCCWIIWKPYRKYSNRKKVDAKLSVFKAAVCKCGNGSRETWEKRNRVQRAVRARKHGHENQRQKQFVSF